MLIKTINPVTGDVINTYQEMSDRDVEDIIEKCANEFLTWSETSFSHRKQKILQLASVLRERKKPYAELMAQEMGKPISFGEAEIEKSALLCEYYAKVSEDFLKPKIVQTELTKSYVTYLPLGIVFGIMPWNFPFWQVLRYAIPNLIAGNTCLLKHAQNTTGSALEIEKLIRDAGFPPNAFRTLVIKSNRTAAVIAHKKIAAVTITGSKNAGSAVANESGKHLKKVVLELGGSDPYIILEDADLEAAADACVKSRLHNSGQVCIAAKRIIAIDSIYNKLRELIITKMHEFIVGNPLDMNTEMGPLAREDLREEVHKQVELSIKQGAKLLMGGKIPEGKGFYYPPTLLSEVKPGITAFDEEVFGPIITLIRAADEKHAIELANNTEYGLGAAVFTANKERGENIAAKKLKAGICSVNTLIRSDPRLPFGGIKHSGFGRELAFEGLTSFMNIKTVLIR